MARKNRPVLPGLSRSTACIRTKSCGRLEGHKNACRPTLSARATMAVKRLPVATEGGVEVLSADRYICPEPKAHIAKRAMSSKRTVKATCRVSKRGTRCDRALGHKGTGTRHRFTGLVTVLPEGESSRMVADTANGQFRTARRARRAPATSRTTQGDVVAELAGR